MSNEWNWHVNSLQTRLNDLQSTIDSIKSCVERRPGLDAATQAIAALIEASTQSENALQEFPTALSQILSDPAIGSLLIGPKGEIVLYNATAEHLLGREYLSDRSMNSIQFSSEDLSTSLITDDLPWSRALKGELLPDVRLHLSRPSRPDTWVNVSATPFRSPQGAITGAVVFIIDTTEEVQLEGSITNLCNTIHEQIAQVGSTHTQLRDLADRLSNVGIQRILSDSGPAPNAPSRTEEDPSRKKSDPRRDAGVSPTAARQVSLPQPAKKDLIPPSPTAKGLTVDIDSLSSGERRVIVPPPPAPGSLKKDAPEVEEETASDSVSNSESVANNDSVSNNTLTESSSFGVDEYDLAHSGTWASLGEQATETASEQGNVSIPEGSKTLEVERIEIEPESAVSEPVGESVSETDQEYPTEDAIQKLPETALGSDDQNATADFIDMSQQVEPLNEVSNEYEAVAEHDDTSGWASSEAESVPSAYSGEELEGEEKPDFWVQEHAQGEAQDVDSERSASEGDQVVDSAKSLFGKFANLTKDSYSEPKAPDDKEPDPALPWPELVDGTDYSEPLWDEYTQSEEEATPWQQDKVGEESAFALPPVVLPETANVVQEPSSEILETTAEMPEEAVYDEAAEVAEAAEQVGYDEGYSEDSHPVSEETEIQSEQIDAEEQPVDEPYAVSEADQISYEGDADYEQAQEEVAAAFDDVDAEEAAEDFSPVEAVETDYTEGVIEIDGAEETAALEETAVVEETAAVEDPAGSTSDTIDAAVEPQIDVAAEADLRQQSTTGGFGKLNSLKDRKPRASASYNRLKPLSKAAELEDDVDYLDEGLTEQVVRFSSDEPLTVDDGGPKRVLVVDDIPVNQKLLLLHLKRLGYEADVASNGQEALDMLAERAYELILMDCDMPVMSGFEAASRIRSNEAYSHRRIPIIALTSYDREGDKEKCIASGMDDYITKGASQKELKDTIERSIVSARMKGDEASTSDESEEAEAPLDITAMLKLYGREEVEEISRLFLSNMGTYIECMQLAIDNKDADSVAHFANAVKGPCAALGMRLMTRLTSDIIAYAESQDWTQVRVKYMRLKAVFVQTREEFKKVCPDDSLLAT